MSIIVRAAKLNDLKDIQDLNLLLFRKEYKEYDKTLNLQWTFGKVGTSYFRKKISTGSNCAFVALEDNKIVGYMVGGIKKAEFYRTVPLMAELDNIIILEEYRSKGIGTLLHNKFVEWCKSKKVKMIRVNASAQNLRAICFYRKRGFKDYALILETRI